MASTAHFPRLSEAAMRQPVPDDARRVADEIVERWAQGEPADALAALQAHPELRRYKTLVLQLAYEEYCVRESLGAPAGRDALLERFPTFATSLQRLLDIDAYCREQNAGLAPMTWPAAGERWLDYQLEEELGRGAFARVFLASEPALGGRHVVMKIARQSGAEAELLGRLEHPHIVPVLTVERDPQTRLTAIVMPYLGRDTLADWLDEGVASGVYAQPARWGALVNFVLSAGVDLGEALAYTHARGLLHQDLKPSNVLLSKDGRPMLLDFNLATKTEHRRVGGTLPYMAPEQLDQLLGGRASVDVRSDVFALGVLLHELLTGKLPFENAAASPAAQQQARRESLAPIEARLAQVAGRRVARLLVACLAVDPALRPQTAAELTAQLRGLTGWKARSERWVRSHPWAVGSLAAANTLVVGGVLFWFAQQPPAHVQAFHQGVWHYQQGEYAAAAEHFTRAKAGGHPAAAVARGRAHLKLGEKENDFRFVAVAIDDFKDPERPNDNPESMVRIAQCYIKLGQLPAAESLYQQAMARGLRSPQILNNLGWICMSSARRPEATGWFDQAIAADPRLQAAYANRAMNKFNIALAEYRPPLDAIADIEEALLVGPPHPYLYRDAASMYCNAISADQAHAEKALDYLERAIDGGFPKESILKDIGFRAIAESPRFKALAERPAPPPVPKFPRVIDIFDEAGFFAAHAR